MEKKLKKEKSIEENLWDSANKLRGTVDSGIGTADMTTVRADNTILLI